MAAFLNWRQSRLIIQPSPFDFRILTKTRVNNMTLSDLEHFKNLLLEREENLNEWLDAPVVASQDDIGKVQSLLVEIKEALGRVENKNFGTCDVCKGDIELYRLEVQPVTEICLGCITPEERAQLEDELYLASKIHRALLPQAVEKVEGHDIAVKSLAARFVGGDYYDLLPASGNGLSRLIIADSMGKGLPASLLMSNVQGALRILAEEIPSPSKLISRLNQWLCRNVPVTKFISLACIALEPQLERRSQVTYTNAGHCPAILVRNDGQVEFLGPTGGVIGVHEGFTYEEKSLSFSKGDLIVLYTDGVIEASNSREEHFGEKRLIDFAVDFKDSPLDGFLDNLRAEVQSFSGRPEFEDDFTVIALRKL